MSALCLGDQLVFLRSWHGRLLLFTSLVLGLASSASAQRFLPDDPLWTDPDRMDTSFPEPRPATRQMGPFEFIGRSFSSPSEYSGPAQNVNTVGGVPNSSWYTNRHYRFPMSSAELRRGPNVEDGPSTEGPWTVLGFLQQKTIPLLEREDLPRAVIRDSTGRRFHIFFDAPATPEMATGAGMIGSRLLHALGYNVPQHWLRRIRDDRLAPAPDTGVTQAGVDSLLSMAHRCSDSTYRVLVTRIPDVERRIGPFRFYGTRPDDDNDIFPHEARRELRGLRVLTAWAHFSSIERRHTLDVGVWKEERRFVRHYLTDLHLTLGSGGADSKPSWSGHEHILDPGPVFERAVTLGLSGGEWVKSKVPDWPAVGHFSAEGFDPRKWQPEFPNPAFKQADSADAFWAAKQVRNFSRSDLATIVGTAEYTSSQVADYILQTLVQRRDSIGRAYLHWGGGLDRFAVQDGQLTFQDLRARYGLAPDSLRRPVTWHVFNNQQNEATKRLTRVRSSHESLALPASRATFLRATIETPRHGQTRVFLRRTAPVTVTSATPAPPLGNVGPYEVVGVERRGPAGKR